MAYQALFGVASYRGYCLWWLRIRQSRNQAWRKAPMLSGRTDTLRQAHGEIFEALGSVGLVALRQDNGHASWRDIRDLLRQPGEGRFAEGSLAWADRRAGHGDRLEQLGGVFEQRWQAEQERRAEEQRQRDTAGTAWYSWCGQHSIDPRTASAEARSQYARAQFEAAEERIRRARAALGRLAAHRNADLALLELKQGPTADSTASITADGTTSTSTATSASSTSPDTNFGTN